MKVCSLLLALLLLLPSAARGGEAEDETPADLPSTTWPNDGRVACPSLQACCVEGEEHCTHPAAARALLAGVSVGHFGVGLAMFAAGDGLDKGDPLGGLVGIGIIGTAGSLLGLVAGLLLVAVFLGRRLARPLKAAAMRWEGRRAGAALDLFE